MYNDRESFRTKPNFVLDVLLSSRIVYKQGYKSGHTRQNMKSVYIRRRWRTIKNQFLSKFAKVILFVNIWSYRRIKHIHDTCYKAIWWCWPLWLDERDHQYQSYEKRETNNLGTIFMRKILFINIYISSSSK